MIPGAALSIIATAILARLGGDFDHLEPWQGHASGAPFRPKSETTQKTRTPPLIVLLHGHKFNSAMWGRYIVSFAFAGYECVSVDYELHSPLRNSAAHDEGIAELAAVAARALTSKLEASRMDDRPSTSMAGAPHSKQVRALRPAVLVGHSLGGLVAAHMAAHDGARAAGLNVRGVIAISTPFDGVYALRWLPCALRLLQAILCQSFQPPRFISDMCPQSASCKELGNAVQRHASRTGCSYRSISGSCDPVVRPDSAFALDKQARGHSASCSSHSLLLANEGHFTITMSDRLIRKVILWAGECLTLKKDNANVDKPPT